MAQDQVEEIKGKTDIVELVADHVELKRAGSNFRGLCPFHSEKTPSFMVSPELQIFKCFGCGLGGDVYRFLMEYEKVDFPESLKILADRCGVKLIPLKGYANFQEKEEIYRVNHTLSEFYHYLLVSHKVGEVARAYLKGRGVDDEAIEVFNLGFAPDLGNSAFRFLTTKKNYKPDIVEKAGVAVQRDNQYFDRFRARIIFPLRDHYGNVLGFAGRVIKVTGEIAKYINSPDTLVYKKGNTLYGLDVTKHDIKKEGFAVVVEGELDAISSFRAGVRNVVAIKGSALTQEQASLLSRFCPQVRLALDSDLAGDKASRRGIEIVEKEGLEQRVVRLGNFKDPDDMARSSPEAWQEAVKLASGIYDFLIDSTFAQFDGTTTEGKARISREIAPILANIDDEIVKSACIKKVAGRLEVSEDAVAAQIAKQPLNKDNGREVTPGPKSKGKREILEEYLLTVAFQTNPKVLQEARIIALVKTPAASRLVGEFNRWSKEHGEFKFGSFAKEVSPELMDFFATLVLSDVEKLNLDKGDQEIKSTAHALEILDMRERMGRLAEEIKSAEDKGQPRALNALEVELAKVSNSLTQLETK
ncbi:MAG: DNA primase [bacterium]|nr:DNA primase [bacterium]